MSLGTLSKMVIFSGPSVIVPLFGPCTCGLSALRHSYVLTRAADDFDSFLSLCLFLCLSHSLCHCLSLSPFSTSLHLSSHRGWPKWTAGRCLVDFIL